MIIDRRRLLQGHGAHRSPERHPTGEMLTQTSELAIQALMYLGRLETEHPVSPRQIATALGCSRTYLLKTLRLLSRARILHTHKGSKGGVTLGLPPQQITLLMVVEACQGLLIGNYCQDLGPGADHIVCAFHQAMLDVHRATVQALQKWTLAQLIDRPGPLDPQFGEVCKMARVLLPAKDSW